MKGDEWINNKAKTTPGKLGYGNTAFIGTMIAIFGSPILTLLISNWKPYSSDQWKKVNY